jgi:hypothetical protein
MILLLWWRYPGINDNLSTSAVLILLRLLAAQAAFGSAIPVCPHQLTQRGGQAQVFCFGPGQTVLAIRERLKEPCHYSGGGALGVSQGWLVDV